MFKTVRTEIDQRLVGSSHHSERAFRLTLHLELTSGSQPSQEIFQYLPLFRSFNEIALIVAGRVVAYGMISNMRAVSFVHRVKV